MNDIESDDKDAARQRKQKGIKKLKSQQWYRKNRGKAKHKSRQRYKKVRNRSTFKRKQHLRRRKPWMHKRIQASFKSLKTPLKSVEALEAEFKNWVEGKLDTHDKLFQKLVSATESFAFEPEISFLHPKGDEVSAVTYVCQESGDIHYITESGRSGCCTLEAFVENVTFLEAEDIENFYEYFDNMYLSEEEEDSFDRDDAVSLQASFSIRSHVLAGLAHQRIMKRLRSGA